MKLDLPYRNRSEAGRFLSAELAGYKCKSNVVVLGLTRGGVPVAAEVAKALQAPLDVVVVRKLGVPFEPELAMGAIAGEGSEFLDQDLIREAGVTEKDLTAVMVRERAEVQRLERLYRAGRAPLELKERTAILVDDGLATGSTMLAAVAFARKRQARRIVMAVPIASVEACEKLRAKVDECVCLATPDPFFAVGEWYWTFFPTQDAEVIQLLQKNAQRTAFPLSA